MALLGSNTVGAIGDIKASMLTLAAFQAKYGTGWVLADGSSCAGSRYALISGNSTLPEARGLFLRGKDYSAGNNPDGDSTLGAYQVDNFQGHYHSINDPGHFHSAPIESGAAGSIACWFPSTTSGINGNTATKTTDLTVRAPSDDGSNGSPRSSSETRSKNITVNYFIRIN